MKKLLPLLLAVMLALCACAPAVSEGDHTDRNVVATTHPVYLFTGAVLEGVEGYELTLMLDQSMSCLHDYTLSVKDMKSLEQADVVVMNGAGLEDTMEDAFATVADTPIIDCSEGIELLPGDEHHHNDGDEEEVHDGHLHGEGDPHIWMDPALACRMLANVAHGMAELDPDNAAVFVDNAQVAISEIEAAYADWKVQLDGLSCRELITFHDGFAYFARAFDLTVLRSIEEEAGSEASARDVVGIVDDIEAHGLPAIFTEKNGSAATAEMISRECGVAVYPLDLLMSGERETSGIAAYLAGLAANVTTLQEAYT